MDNELLKWTFEDLFKKYLNPRQKLNLASSCRAYFIFIYPKILGETTFPNVHSNKKKKKRYIYEDTETTRKCIFTIPLSLFLLPPAKLKIPKRVVQYSMIFLITKHQEEPYVSMSTNTQTDILQSLLRRGALVNAMVPYYVAQLFFGEDANVVLNPLSYAAISGNHSAARILLQSGALDSPCERGELPIDYAAQLAHRGVVRAIVEESAKIEARTKAEAAKKKKGGQKKGKIEGGKGEVDREKEKVDGIKERGEKERIEVDGMKVNKEKLDGIEEMEEEKARKEGEKEMKEGEEERIEGEEERIERVVEGILKIGRKMTIKNMVQDFSLFQIACYLGCTEVVVWFLAHIRFLHLCPFRKFTTLGLSPAHLAAMSGHVEILHILMKRTNWDTQGRFYICVHSDGVWSFSPLQLAAHFGHADCVELLLQSEKYNWHNFPHPDKLSAQQMNSFSNCDCSTLLDMAAREGHKTIVEIILRHHNAQLLSMSIKGKSIADLITELGTRAKGASMPTLFLQAVSEKNSELAKILWEYSYPYGPIFTSPCYKFLHVLSQEDFLRDLPDNPIADVYPSPVHHLGTIQLPPVPKFPRIKTDVNCSLLGACFLGDMELFQKSSTTIWSKSDLSTLRIAAAQGHTEIVLALLQKNAAWFSPTKALPAACFGGHVSLVRKLLEMGAKIEDSLFVACRFGHGEVVKVLLEAGAAINQHKITRNQVPLYYPIHYAAMGGSVEVIRELLKAGDDVNKMEISATSKIITIPSAEWTACGVKRALHFVPFTPLQVALSHGHAEAASALIDAGAFLKKEKESLEATTLFFATTKGCSEMVKKCVEEGAYADSVLKHMLILAAFHGHAGVVRALIDRVNLSQEWGGEKDPAVYAVLGGNTEILAMMMERGARVVGEWTRVVPRSPIRGIPVSHRPHTMEGALEIVLQEGKVDMLTFLLDHGLDVNEKIGRLSVLKKALTENAPIKVVKLLVKRGAHVEQEHLQAAFLKETELLSYLLAHVSKSTSDQFFATPPGIQIPPKMDKKGIEDLYILKSGTGEGWMAHCSNLSHVQTYLQHGARISKSDFDTGFNLFDLHSLISTIVDYHICSEDSATILLVEHFCEAEFKSWLCGLDAELCASYTSPKVDKLRQTHAWLLRFKTHADLRAARTSARAMNLDVVFPLLEISATPNFGNFFYYKK